MYMNGVAFIPKMVAQSNSLNGLGITPTQMRAAAHAAAQGQGNAMRVALNSRPSANVAPASRPAGNVAPQIATPAIRATTGKPAPMLPGVRLRRAPRLVGHSRRWNGGGIFHRPGYRSESLRGIGFYQAVTPKASGEGMGWYQAVANIIGAGASVYASKEGTKAANIQAGIQREATAGAIQLEQERRKTLEAEAQFSIQKAAASPLAKIGLPLMLAGAGIVTMLVLRRKSR